MALVLYLVVLLKNVRTEWFKQILPESTLVLPRDQSMALCRAARWLSRRAAFCSLVTLSALSGPRASS